MDVIRLHFIKRWGVYNYSRSHRTSNGWVTTSVEYENYFLTCNSDNCCFSYKERDLFDSFLKKYKDEESYDTDMAEWHKEASIPLDDLINDLNKCQCLHQYVQADDEQPFLIKNLLNASFERINETRRIFDSSTRKMAATVNDIQKQYCDTLLKELHPIVVRLLEDDQIDPKSTLYGVKLLPADILLYNEDAYALDAFIIRYRVTYNNISQYFKILDIARLYYVITSGEDITYSDILDNSVKGFPQEESVCLKELVSTIELRNQTQLEEALKNIISIVLAAEGTEVYFYDFLPQATFVKNYSPWDKEFLLFLQNVREGKYESLSMSTLHRYLFEKDKITHAEARLLKLLLQEPQKIDECICCLKRLESFKSPSREEIVSRAKELISKLESHSIWEYPYYRKVAGCMLDKVFF